MRNALSKQTNTENLKHRLIDKIANKIHTIPHSNANRDGGFLKKLEHLPEKNMPVKH